MICAAWFIIGAEDRYLVRAYRQQANVAGRALVQCIQFGEDETKLYEPVGWLKTRSKDLDTDLGKRTWLERITEWRCEPISITRLPCLPALLALSGWLFALVVQMRTQ